jgi:ketosteroid isomerase-like protein
MAEVPRERREIIEGMVEASNRGDIEGVLQRAHPEIEIDDPERTGTSRGHQAVRDFSGEWLENFEEYWVEIEEMEEGPDGVFVALTQRGKGRGSGIEFELPLHYVLRFRDGKVALFGVRTEAADARREVGLD